MSIRFGDVETICAKLFIHYLQILDEEYNKWHLRKIQEQKPLPSFRMNKLKPNKHFLTITIEN